MQGQLGYLALCGNITKISLSDLGTDKYLITITDFKFKNKTQVD